MLADRIRVHPPSDDSPWGFVIYADEVVPGNPMGVHNKRKVWVIFLSFAELGNAALMHEDAWFCVAAERADRVKRIAGGIGQNS